MEKEKTNAISTWIKILLRDMNTLHGILSDIFLFYVQPLINLIHTKPNTDIFKKSNPPKAQDHQEKLLSLEEIKMVMGRIGIVWHQDEVTCNNFREKYDGASEISRLFEEEPSLDELKEAFDIFDYDKDGLIDDKDLQRMLYCLGFNNEEESKMEKCRRMIMAVKKDEDDDPCPTIDFNEFVIFMEKCFC